MLGELRQAVIEAGHGAAENIAAKLRVAAKVAAEYAVHLHRDDGYPKHRAMAIAKRAALRAVLNGKASGLGLVPRLSAAISTPLTRTTAPAAIAGKATIGTETTPIYATEAAQPSEQTPAMIEPTLMPQQVITIPMVTERAVSTPVSLTQQAPTTDIEVTVPLYRETAMEPRETFVPSMTVPGVPVTTEAAPAVRQAPKKAGISPWWGLLLAVPFVVGRGKRGEV
jgi:hypothetical protein